MESRQAFTPNMVEGGQEPNSTRGQKLPYVSLKEHSLRNDPILVISWTYDLQTSKMVKLCLSHKCVVIYYGSNRNQYSPQTVGFSPL